MKLIIMFFVIFVTACEDYLGYPILSIADEVEEIAQENNPTTSVVCLNRDLFINDKETMEAMKPLICTYGTINIGYSSDIDIIDLPNLTYAGGLTITYNSALTVINIPNLIQLDEVLMITMNEHLPTCEGYKLVVQLREVNGLKNGSLVSGNALDGCYNRGDCYQWDFTVTSPEDADLIRPLSCMKKPLVVESDILTSLQLKNLKRLGNKLIIRNSPLLSDVQMDSLTYVRGVEVTNNPLLPNCNITDILTNIVNKGQDPGMVILEGNLEDECTWE